MSAAAAGRRLALFDLDGTLLRGASSERRFAAHLVRTGLVGPRQALAWLVRAGLETPRHGRHALKRDKGYLYALGTERIAREAERCVAALAAEEAFDPRALAALAEHRRAGDATLLLSGTLQPVAEAVAARLGMDGAIGTLVDARRGRYRFATPRRHPFGAAKRALGRDAAAARGFDARAVVAYGDSIHARALLDWAGTAVAVEPDAALGRLARARGWRVLAHAPRSAGARVPGSAPSR